MTPAELSAIEARANAATPGPWEATECSDVLAVYQGARWCVAEPMGPHRESDAAFIAAARVDIPKLLAEVRRLAEESAMWQLRAETALMDKTPTAEQIAYGRDIVAPRINAQYDQRVSDALQLLDNPAYGPSDTAKVLGAEVRRLQAVSSAVTYSSDQATKCARCGVCKHTPLRRDEMHGYVCLTCIDEELDRHTDSPRYSTEAVDALVALCTEHLVDLFTTHLKSGADQLALPDELKALDGALVSVRASREPQR